MRKIGYKTLVRNMLLEEVTQQDIDNLENLRADFLSALRYDSTPTRYDYDMRSYGAFVNATSDMVEVYYPYRILRSSIDNTGTQSEYDKKVYAKKYYIKNANSYIPVSEFQELEPFNPQQNSSPNDYTLLEITFLIVHKLSFYVGTSGSSSTESKSSCYYSVLPSEQSQKDSIFNNHPILKQFKANGYKHIPSDQLYNQVATIVDDMIDGVIKQFTPQQKQIASPKNTQHNTSASTIDKRDRSLIEKVYKQYTGPLFFIHMFK